MLTLKQALQRFSLELEPFSDSPRLDAQILILFFTGITREKFLAYPDFPLSADQEQMLIQGIQRRQNGEPIAYIVGYREFWSMTLSVSPDTLIPRPETECLVEWVLQKFSSEKKWRLADLGTGSGAIAIALAHERALWEIHATDLNEKALAIAKSNAEKFTPGRILFFHGDWCSALEQHDYDLIISNPPYIAQNDPHLKALRFEPNLALISGKDGLEAIRKIAETAKGYLRSDGYLVLEHGFDQSQAVCHILKDFGYNEIEAYRDLGGLERFVVGQYSSTKK